MSVAFVPHLRNTEEKNCGLDDAAGRKNSTFSADSDAVPPVRKRLLLLGIRVSAAGRVQKALEHGMCAPIELF